MTTWAGPRRATHPPPRAASLRGLAAAMAELQRPAAGQPADQLLAERERLAQDAEAESARQGVLRLGAQRQ